MGQPLKGIFVVALAFAACTVAAYLRAWGRSTIPPEAGKLRRIFDTTFEKRPPWPYDIVLKK
jgi:hypothetical protein